MPTRYRSEKPIDIFAFLPVLSLSVAVIFALSCVVLRAQTIEVRLVNGRTGQPLADDAIVRRREGSPARPAPRVKPNCATTCYLG
jgi:hypothetical protein